MTTILPPTSSTIHGLALSAEMARISQFSMTRRDIIKVARILNFLVFDDDIDTPGDSVLFSQLKL